MNYIKKCLLTTAVFVLSLGFSLAQLKPSSYVNVFIGTQGVGHTFPGATVPFGMVQLGPDTGWNSWSYCSGYQYKDTLTYGFSHTHLSGTGGADLADILFLPLTKDFDNLEDKVKPIVGMKKKTEKAKPGYYTICLDNGIKAEFSATERCGIHRYHFPKGRAFIFLDLTHVLKGEEKVDDSSIEQVSVREIKGMRITTGWSEHNPVYFHVKFSQDIKSIKKINAKGSRVIIEFIPDGKPLDAFVGLSATSFEGAINNLTAETRGLTFEETIVLANKKWDAELGKIQINDPSKDKLTVFYTSLYHTMVCPNIFSDADGKYLGMDGKIRQTNSLHYHTFSFWDTFRAVHPLFNLLNQERAQDMLISIIEKARYNNGIYPKWELWGVDTDCMIGNHAISVLAEAMVMGVEGFDYKEAYQYCKNTLHPEGEQLSLYQKYGFIPSNECGVKSVSKTLEYAYNDYCMAMMATILGYSGDYHFYLNRSLNYKNLFNSENGFMQGRLNTRDFMPDFSGNYMDENFTEATPWQYLHFVPHDVMGLINLFGGRERFTQSLDELFNADTIILGRRLPDVSGNLGQYAHGNEPSHGTIFLYNYSSEPWKTSFFTRKVLSAFYKNDPKGLCGNDDCGQMSAWNIFSSLGMYPMSPVNNELLLTAPYFKEAIITLPQGKKFIIKVNGDLTNEYINKIWLNGKEIDRNYLTYKEFTNGGELVFELCPEPNKIRAIADSSLPGSLTKSFILPAPQITTEHKFFTDNHMVDIISIVDGAKIFYTLDGSDPDSKNGTLYEKPFWVNQTTNIKAVAYKDSKVGSIMKEVIKREPWLNSYDVSLESKQNRYCYTYYEGSIQNVSQMLSMKPVKTGYTNNINNIKTLAEREFHWGIIIKAWINIDVEDIYAFHVFSDDGAVLFIDDVEVLNNDGNHSNMRASGKVALRKGPHKLELRYSQGTYNANLSLGIKGGDLDRWGIPNEMIFERE